VSRTSGNRYPLIIAAAAMALCVVVVAAFSVGRYPVTLSELLRVVWSWVVGAPHGLNSTIETVVLQIRGPRVIAAVLVGAALAAAGAAYQNLFRNPLVSPDILGVSAGAAVGAILGIFLSLGVVAIQSMAFTSWHARCAATIRCWCWCSPVSCWVRCWAPAWR
jgi:iron complex transport system permease protein